MDFMNKEITQKTSKRVDIYCQGTVQYSFVSHLSAALRREGISPVVRVDDNIPSDPFYQPSTTRSTTAIVTSEIVDANDSRSFKLIKVHVPLIVNDSLIMSESRIIRNWILTDSELVEEVVNDIYEKLYPAERVGVYSKLLEIENLLYMQPELPDNVRSMGIWGMPGIGKTTLAKAVFTHMSTDYDASCFIENLDEAFHKQGLHHLLETTLGNLLVEKFDIKASYVMRPNFHKDKLCDKRILLVLDDVRDSMAADSFLRRLDWFGPGSLIIMTSTDKQVFSFCHINQIFEVQGLNKREALQLFSQYAFEHHMLEKNDGELSKKVIEYANGNPSALSIYGRKLKGKHTEMESTFLDLKSFPPQEMQDLIKNVYSALDDNEKNIFLDIAFFFKGENVNYVVQLLEGCRYLPRVGIDVLVDKCALTVSENTVQIGNLFQDIFLMIFSREMESSTRMLEPNSIRYLLEDDELKASGESISRPNCCLVAEDIESIVLDTSNLKFDVKHDAFKNMFNLKFLKIYGSCSVPALNFPKGLHSLPRGLRFLLWENYPLQSLPQDFDLDNLFELCMFYSQLQTLGPGAKNLKMLKRIRLCHSQKLIEFDLPSKAQDIELIDLQGCSRLRNFPDTSQLHNLRVVNLSGCTKIIEFQGAPPNIEELHLEGTSIREIPISIVSHSPHKVKLDRHKLLNLLENFQDVKHLDLKSVTELAKLSSYNQGFGKLVHLNMKNCSHLRSLPDMVNLESLQVLHLSGCSELEQIKGFPRKLFKLYLGGTAVVKLPELPKTLEFLNAHSCTYLKLVNLDFEQLPKHYTFSNCLSFSAEVIAEFLKRGVSRVASLARAQQQEVIKAPDVFSICIPAGPRQRSIFVLQEGPSVTINSALLTQKALSGFAMSVVVSFQNDYHNVVGLGIRCVSTWTISNLDRFGYQIERVFPCWAPMEAPKVDWDHIFIFYDTFVHSSYIEVKFEFQTVGWKNESLYGNCKVTQCDVKVVTAPTNDTSLSEITRESEATSMIEEYPPSSSTEVEAMRPNPILSSQPPEVSCKLRSKGTSSSEVFAGADSPFQNAISFTSSEHSSSSPPISPEEEEIYNRLRSTDIFDHQLGLILLRKMTTSSENLRVLLCTDRILSFLRSLLVSRSNLLQTNAAVSLINLSLEKQNKVKIVRSGFVPLLIDVLKSGTMEAQEHVAGVLLSLALEDEYKMVIGVLGAVEPLLHTLRSSESEKARQAAALALYHLTLISNNRAKLVRADAVPTLLSMLRSRGGEPKLANRILLVLCNLAACPDGKGAMLNENAVAILVEKLREGGVDSEAAARENCVAVLLTLCQGNLRFKGQASEAGAEEVLMEVEKSGNARVKVMVAKILQAIRGGDGESKFEDKAEAREWNRMVEVSGLSRGHKGGFAYSRF